jgi:hypothetical protein
MFGLKPHFAIPCGGVSGNATLLWRGKRPPHLWPKIVLDAIQKICGLVSLNTQPNSGLACVVSCGGLPCGVASCGGQPNNP